MEPTARIECVVIKELVAIVRAHDDRGMAYKEVSDCKKINAFQLATSPQSRAPGTRMTSTQQRAALQRQIWAIANEVRGSVDGWDFKQFVLGTLFYRFISENFAL